jgi:hypothetical protein
MDKRIKFDNTTRDYAAYVNGELIGFASTYQAAEDMADTVCSQRIANAVVMVRTEEIIDSVVALKDRVFDSLTSAQANAFNKAYNYILENDAVLYNRNDITVIVESATDDHTRYIAGDTCQCQAFESGKLCWHRTLARIVKRALETR